jgi:hypothetical protein
MSEHLASTLYDLKLLQWYYTLKSSWAISCVNVEFKTICFQCQGLMWWILSSQAFGCPILYHIGKISRARVNSVLSQHSPHGAQNTQSRLLIASMHTTDRTMGNV